MHKNKTIKRRNKYSKKTRRKNSCVTYEVIRTRKLIKELRIKNRKNLKMLEGKEEGGKN
jgi:hypothetical protein